MSSVIVIRRVPPAIIGVVGVIRDPAFDAFEERLDWLEAASCLPVLRLDPDEPDALQGLPPSIVRAAADAGEHALPLIVVNDVLVSRGVYPTRTQLAHWVGSHPVLTDVCAAQ